MRVNRWLTMTALAAVVVTTVLAYSTTAGATDARKSGTTAPGNETLTYVMSTEPISLDPAMGTDSQSLMIMRNVYDRLVEVAPSGHGISPGLARSWKISAGGTRYLFQLRRGVKFHSGDPLTADAVVYSLKRLLALGTGDAPLLAEHVAPAGITAPTPQTVAIKLKKPYSPILQIIGMSNIGAIVNPAFVKEHATKKDPYARKYLNDHADGTGAYSLIRWTHNQEIDLERNGSYWRGPAKIANLVFKTPGNATSQLLALKRGDVDIIDANVLGADQLKTLNGDAKVKIQQQPVLDTMYWIINTKIKPFDDVRVRQAISYAIDYNGIIKSIVQSQGTRLKGPIPAGLLAGRSTILGYPYNPTKARQLLKQAGYETGLKLTDWYVDFGPLKPIAQVIQTNLEAVGIDVELRETPLSTLVKQVTAGKLAFFSWASNPSFASPDAVLANHFECDASTGVEGNLARYCNPKVDALMKRAERATSRQAADNAFRAAGALITKDAPWIFILQSVKNTPMRASVAGFQTPVIGGADFWPVRFSD